MTAPAWWEEHPDRLLKEISALESCGTEWSRADDAGPGGVLVLDVTVPGPEGPVVLRAVYPDEFPLFAPHVTGPDLGFEHHYERRSGAVCLLASGGRSWLPSRTLAWLLTEQWPKVIAANQADGRAPDGSLLETDQAEPWTAYVSTEQGPHVILDGEAALTGDVAAGPGTFAIARPDPLIAVVMTLAEEGASRTLFAAGARHLADRSARPLWWVRLDKVPDERDPHSLWKAAITVDPVLGERAWAPAPERGVLTGSRRESNSGRQAQLILVCVPEETGRRRTGAGWIALMRTRSQPRKPPGRVKAYRVARAGHNDLYLRAPSVRDLQHKSVLVVGTGGLGAAVVVELGKLALRRLVLIDGDIVDAAAAVRFTGATKFAGTPKVQALVAMVMETQPYTAFVAHCLHLGRPRPPGAPNVLGLLRDEVDRADLVIDCTADLGAQQLLSDACSAAGTGYFQAEATHGVWGGLLALHRPDSDTCWVCVQHQLADGTLPAPPASPEPSAQPLGCLEPTYPGTGFDLASISAQAVRMAVSYLTGPSGYGPGPVGVVTVRLRDELGAPMLPQWKEHVLKRHPSCDNHA